MTRSFSVGAMLAGCAMIAGLSLTMGSRAPVVHAQTQATQCDATSLSGAYGYSLSGIVYDSQGYTYYLGSAGRLVPDGAGNLSGNDTFNLDGSLAKRPYTGSYTVNADCTGSMTWNTAAPIGAMHFDFVLVNNNRKINLVQTDSGFILNGSVELQSTTSTSPVVVAQ